jgi:hypothetical protein
MSDSCVSLAEAFAGLTDPRKPRGVRHPFAGLLALAFLGLLCRRCDFASIARWAKKHWDSLKEPLGFDRPKAPHATTISRACQRYSADEFNAAIARWIAGLSDDGPAAAAVDGKTDKRGLDKDGDPIHVLNVFAHDLKVSLACWPVGDGKQTEAETLKARLGELFRAYPQLRLLTMDAGMTQRDLAGLIIGHGRDYLMAVKDNQPNLREAAETAFAGVDPKRPHASTTEKVKGGSRPGASGSTWGRPSTPGRPSTSRA